MDTEGPRNIGIQRAEIRLLLWQCCYKE